MNRFIVVPFPKELYGVQRPARLWTPIVDAGLVVAPASVAINFAEGSELRSGARTFRLRRKKLSPD